LTQVGQIGQRGDGRESAWDDNLDGADYGQPLVYNGMAYVATENDTVYAIAATNGLVRWSVHVGTPVSTSVLDSAPGFGNYCGDIDPLGITGTPVIDPARDELFAVGHAERPTHSCRGVGLGARLG